MKKSILKRLEELEKVYRKDMQAIVIVKESDTDGLYIIQESIYIDKTKVINNKYEVTAEYLDMAVTMYKTLYMPEDLAPDELLIMAVDYGNDASKLLMEFICDAMTVEELQALVDYSESKYDPALEEYFNGLFKKYRQQVIDELGITKNPCTVDMIKAEIGKRSYLKR